MAKITADWTEDVEFHASASLAAAASVTDDIDLDNLGAEETNIEISIAFGSTPDGDVLVELLASVDSGTLDGTVPVHSQTIERVTSTTVRALIPIAGYAYLAVRVTNNDTTDSVTYIGTHAWKRRDST